MAAGQHMNMAGGHGRMPWPRLRRPTTARKGLDVLSREMVCVSREPPSELTLVLYAHRVHRSVFVVAPAWPKAMANGHQSHG